MKFLCVPCDSPMKLQTVGPPEGGSLSVVYSCPECGYEMAMLTNPYETQLVSSLGVRIGPEEGGGAPSLAESSAEAVTSGSRCPFTAMIPLATPKPLGEVGATEGAHEGTGHAGTIGGAVQPVAVRWTAAAEARLANIPEFVRPMARTGIDRFARERGAVEVDEKMLDAARDFFGM
jgi:hypothetical protein